MKLSSKSLYGLKACYVLAAHYGSAPVSAAALEKEIFVSGKYLEKILRMLASRDLVGAERGVNGGYYLKRPPAEITVGEVVRTLEDDMEFVRCVSGSCGKCAPGKVWIRLYEEINKVLDSMTLESMGALECGQDQEAGACRAEDCV